MGRYSGRGPPRRTFLNIIRSSHHHGGVTAQNALISTCKLPVRQVLILPDSFQIISLQLVTSIKTPGDREAGTSPLDDKGRKFVDINYGSHKGGLRRRPIMCFGPDRGDAKKIEGPHGLKLIEVGMDQGLFARIGKITQEKGNRHCLHIRWRLDSSRKYIMTDWGKVIWSLCPSNTRKRMILGNYTPRGVRESRISRRISASIKNCLSSVVISKRCRNRLCKHKFKVNSFRYWIPVERPRGDRTAGRDEDGHREHSLEAQCHSKAGRIPDRFKERGTKKLYCNIDKEILGRRMQIKGTFKNFNRIQEGYLRVHLEFQHSLGTFNF